MKKANIYCLFVLAFLNGHCLLAQRPVFSSEKIDSLKAVLINAKEDSNKVKSLFGVGENYYWLPSPATQSYGDSASKYFKLALELSERVVCNPNLKGRVLNALGTVYMAPNPPEGLRFLFAALKIWRASGYKLGEATSYHNIANVYASSMGDHAEALKYNLAALELRKGFNNMNNLRASYANIANNYYDMGKYSEALENYLMAFKIDGEDMSNITNPGSLIALGKCYAQLEKYEESLKYLFAALQKFKEQKNKPLLGNSYINIGICYAKKASSINNSDSKEEYSKALEYLNNGLSLLPATWRGGRREAYFWLSEVYSNSGNFEKALGYKNRFIALNDSILSKETQNRIGQLRIEFETEQATTQEKAKNEKLMIQEMAVRENLLAKQKFKQEKELADEKNRHELKLAEEKFFQQSKATEEKLKYDKSIALEKARQEKLKLEKERTNILLLIGISAISIVSWLLFLLFRQQVIKKRAIEKAESLHKMTELELQSLRAQLNPHFMFNSLNAIQELILKEDNDNSHLYLSRFSELLRMLLDNANQPFVSLRKEINLLELYLSLENLRIPDLKYTIEIDPAIDSNRIAIPNMMLQPYIENAIWHGLSHKKGERSLIISINKKGDNIICEVEDNGVGRKIAADLKSLYRKEHRSRGMELLSKRFSLLSKEYGSDIQTTVEDLHDNGTATGTRVAIIVPYSLTKQAKPVYS